MLFNLFNKKRKFRNYKKLFFKYIYNNLYFTLLNKNFVNLSF